MSIDLRTCQVGQKVERGDGIIIEYERWDRKDDEYPHEIGGYWYTNDGRFKMDSVDSQLDIARIIPLEPAKTNKHPSVAAWESFPWITDRKPTLKDTTQRGEHMDMVLTFDGFFFRLRYYLEVRYGEKWIHLPNWTPPKLTPQEEALALLEGKDDNWVPSVEEWLVFRKAIKP